MIIAEVDKTQLEQKQEIDIAQVLDGVSKALYALEILFADELNKQEKPKFYRMDKKAYVEMVKREQALGHRVQGMSY